MSAKRLPRRSSDRLAPARRPRRDLALEAAIRDEAFAIHYQPQIDPVSGAVRAAEALARWEGSAGAEELFARAARVRLDERLSRALQRRSLQAAGRWEGPLGALGLSLNVLPQDLARPSYTDWLLAEIAAAGLAPERLTIEIVESALIADHAALADRLGALRAHGIAIAVDDFGTGYANLAWLTALPLDAIKVDRGLIAGIAQGPRERIVVASIIAMARELGLKVVVEGVESRAQLQLLADWGVDLYQGFLGAGALGEEELSRFVVASNVAPAAA